MGDAQRLEDISSSRAEDIKADIKREVDASLGAFQGRLETGFSLHAITWFRVGGQAQLIYMPHSRDELACVLRALPSDMAVHVFGLGSNVIIRDGGINGLVIRLGRNFAQCERLEDYQIQAGCALPDVKLAKFSAEEEIDGLAFYRGIPGALGGALRMNAGAYGGETKDVLIEAEAVDRQGQIHKLSNEDMGYAYRHCSVPSDYIFTCATFAGRAGKCDDIQAQMDNITASREKTQPIKGRTGGSTFKNPQGHKAWQLIDAAGCRGLQIGGAQVSELHCNFLLNTGNATAHDIETLGETVRQRVLEHSGVALEWEIKRVGEALHLKH